MWCRNEVLLVLIQYIWIFVSDILFIWQYGFFHESTASTIQILQDLNILMKSRDTSFLNLMYSFSFVNSFSLSFWMCLLGLFLTHYQKHLGCSSYLQPGYTVYVCLKCRCLKVCGFCFELENFDPVLLCITTPESSWTDFWNHLQKDVKWLMVMLKMQKENYMVIHAVLSRSLTFYLQPNKLELLGDLDSVEDQCQQDVC